MVMAAVIAGRLGRWDPGQLERFEGRLEGLPLDDADVQLDDVREVCAARRFARPCSVCRRCRLFRLLGSQLEVGRWTGGLQARIG